MKIQSVNLINFGLKKITNKKAYKKNISTPPADNRAKDKTLRFNDFYSERFENRKICIASADGNTILTKDANYYSTSIELVERKGDKTETTKFTIDKRKNVHSNCSYRISEHGKTRKMALEWDFPGKNFNYKGSPKDMVKLRKAVQNLRNTIHQKEYVQDFGYIEPVNFQFKTVIGYLQDEIDNHGKY